jgi:hypothetical protein
MSRTGLVPVESLISEKMGIRCSVYQTWLKCGCLARGSGGVLVHERI